jgi:hypothetical protein
VGPRTGLDDVERKKILPLPRLELRPLGRPARSYSDCAIPALNHIHAESYQQIYVGLIDGWIGGSDFSGCVYRCDVRVVSL